MSEFILKDVKDFNLSHIFDCGQCFRWKKEDDGCYVGVVKYGVVKARMMKNDVHFSSNFDGLKEFIFDYFDLKRDYCKIKKILKKDDLNMRDAILHGEGIRILNQDPWEMLISFIISAANNIPRISKTIENLSKSCGKKVTFDGEDFFLFPTPDELSKLSLNDLRVCNLGFRDKYIYEASRMVLSGDIDILKIMKMDFKDAEKELMRIPGVGRKVADCVLLFSMGKMEAFPVDTWIKKIMHELYIDSTNITKISDYAAIRFGEYAGIAQQYLFFYERDLA